MMTKIAEVRSPFTFLNALSGAELFTYPLENLHFVVTGTGTLVAYTHSTLFKSHEETIQTTSSKIEFIAMTTVPRPPYLGEWPGWVESSPSYSV